MCCLQDGQPGEIWSKSRPQHRSERKVGEISTWSKFLSARGGQMECVCDFMHGVREDVRSDGVLEECEAAASTGCKWGVPNHQCDACALLEDGKDGNPL